MKKLKMRSPDLTGDNIARIRDLFPGCVSETRDENGELRLAIDFDQLRQELSDEIIEGPQERYRLDWPGKREAMLAANSPIAKTLRPCREESVDFDTTKNLFIEGDNLDALKLLQETYLGKVKMIYIDPPYNTGNDFIYKDNFAEKTEEFLKETRQKDHEGNRLMANTEANGRFHSDWLSMIYPRLKLARNLLSDSGVIFISIDDGELHNIRKICDEVFGVRAFVGVFPWRSRTAKADVPFGVSNDVEWVVAYANANFLAGRTGERKYYYSDDYPEGWRLQDLTKNTTKYERPNSFFTMVNPKNGDEYPANELRTWSVTTDTFSDYYQKGKIVFPGDYGFLKIQRPAFRVFENEDRRKALSKYGTEDVRKAISTRLPDTEIGRTEHGTKEIRELFDEAVFPYPKPTSLVQYFVENISEKEALIVDFFAGSGTTAQAVCQQNAKDGGTRKYILVQLAEMLDEALPSQKSAVRFCQNYGLELNISSLTKERIRRAGKKIRGGGDCHPDWNKDIGFRVLKVDTSNMADVYYTPQETRQSDLLAAVDTIKPGRDNPEDLLFQVLVDWGVDLTLPIRRETIRGKTIFFVNHEPYDLIACFDEGITEELVRELAAYKPLRVVFRDNGFASDAVKINVDQIFRQLSSSTDVKSI